MIERKKEFNWRLFWNTRQEYVLAILLFVLSFMILMIGTFSQIGPIRDSLQTLKSKQAEVAKFESKANQLNELANDKEFKKSSEIDMVLPSHKPLLEILTNLNNVANTTEVVVKNFSLNPGAIASDSTQVKKTVSTEKYNYLDLDFSVTGPLWKVQNFMTLIEQTTPISTITSISLNRNIAEDKNAEAQATLILRTFYFTQPIKTTITSPLPEINNEDQKILANISNLRPNNLEEQTEVIPGNRGNLFGIETYSVEELEAKLLEEQQEAEAGNQEENKSTENSETETTSNEELLENTPVLDMGGDGGSLYDALGIEDYQIVE